MTMQIEFATCYKINSIVTELTLLYVMYSIHQRPVGNYVIYFRANFLLKPSKSALDKYESPRHNMAKAHYKKIILE